MIRRKRREGRRPRKAGQHRFSAWLHTSAAKCTGIVLIACVFLVVMFCFACAPQRYDLKVGSISRHTITATKDVVDEVTTQERKNVAAAAVEPTYHLQEGASEQVLSQLASVFDELRLVQQYGLTLRDPEDTPETIRNRQFTDDEINYARDMVTTLTLSKHQLSTLLRTETSDFDTMVTTVTTAVTNSLNTTIREGQLSQSISNISAIVGFRVELSLMQNILPLVLRTCIQPNMVIDQEATDLARQNAMNEVENVVYLQGRNIVREGEIVQHYQIEMLRSLGLLENNEYDITGYIGGFLLVMAGVISLLLLLRLLCNETLTDLRKLSVIMLVTVLSVALSMAVIGYIQVYLAPIVLAGMLLTALLGWQAGLAGLMGTSVIISGIAVAGNTTTSTQMASLLLMGLVSGVFSVWFLHGKTQRMRLVLCALVDAVINALLLSSVHLMTSSNLNGLPELMPWVIGGAVFSGLTAVGLQPLFEAVFNLATPSKLTELGSQNHPLLRRLMLEAPGTYHHSMIVANLAEAAANRIGANATLARTGAYFHDVGKLKRPQYFKENQMGENPLDITDPYVSAAIVTSHTRDGLQLAQKYRLPPEIQRIIVEHHGDTPVMFFYHKALQMADGNPVDISDFRYDNGKPSTKEAAIIMLADTVEAAVRSMANPTPQAMEEFIGRLVRGKLEDGQLSNSPLTFRDVNEICDAFITVLSGVFHQRIEYPTTEIPQRSPVHTQAEEKPEAPSDENHNNDLSSKQPETPLEESEVKA